MRDLKKIEEHSRMGNEDKGSWKNYGIKEKAWKTWTKFNNSDWGVKNLEKNSRIWNKD
jgi:hypothetical protein